MHEGTELSPQPDLFGCSSYLFTLPHFPSQNTMPTKIYLDFQKPKPQQRYCSPFAHQETKQKCANENSRNAFCLSSIFADTSFTPPTTTHWRAWPFLLSHSLCANAPKLESKKGDFELFTLKPWKCKALPSFFNQIADENVGVIFTKNPNYQQTLNQPRVLLELHEPFLSRVGWVFAVYKIPVILQTQLTS